MIKYLLLITFSMLWANPEHSANLSTAARNGLVGTWSLMAVENTYADGRVTYPYGKNPAGRMILTNGGDYSIQILKSDRPHVAANNKAKGTHQENAALVKGSNSHFGRYVVDESKYTITFDVRHAFFPNWEGHLQVRSYTLKDKVLTYIVTNTTSGGKVKARVVWQKK